MIDIDSLLEPISAESPCGEDMSYSAQFDAIQEARRCDDATLDQGEWVADIKASDWPAVIKQCSELLTTQSKDLRLTVWMVEAGVHNDGFAGLADGYRLLAELCDRYWDDLYPKFGDEGDLEMKVGNLRWMLGQSSDWIRSIALTNAPEAKYTAVDLEMAVRGHSGEGATSYPDSMQVDAARNATPFDFYQHITQDAPRAQAELKHLESVLDARLGMDGPSFSATRDLLDDVVGTALRLASAAGVVGSDAVDAPAADSAPTDAAQPATARHASGEITTRNEALLQLQRIADFFRRTEPHSPVAYLAERAARWGNMPLHVWLKSVLKEDSALTGLQELLDVKVGSDESEN